MVASLRSPRRVLVATFLVTSLFLLLALRHRQSITGPANHAAAAPFEPEHGGGQTTGVVTPGGKPPEGKKKNEHDLELVVASVKAEDTSWFHTHLPSWHKNIYVADDPGRPADGAAQQGPRGHGVPDVHDLAVRRPAGQRAVRARVALRLAQRRPRTTTRCPRCAASGCRTCGAAGYVNLRCVWVIGCPAEIRPAQDEAARDGADALLAKHVYKEAFGELFPATPVPDVVAVSCCSQFGVTRETIRSRPRADYIRYRDWLLATPLDDALNGRVFEFAWHS